MTAIAILFCLCLFTPYVNSACKLPEHPANGKWQVFGATTSAAAPQPNGTVPAGTPLFVTCNEGFKLLDTQLGLCDGQQFQWQTRMGHCSKMCPDIATTDLIKVTCTLEDRRTGDFGHVKCSEATDGTVAQFECAEYYTITVNNSTEYLRSGGSGLSKCLNGKWTVDKPNCNPKCGIKSLTGVALSVRGTRTSKGSYPWQVAIYEHDDRDDEFYFTCGGSLINEKVAVTAAHCVADNEGNARPKDIFRIAGGKYYQNWTDKRDSDEFQANNVQEVMVPSRYKGFSQNFYGDLAILIMEKPFQLNSQIQPICVDWNKIYRSKFLTPMNIGYVSGWGVVSESGAPSDELQEIELPYVTNDVCSRAISNLDQGYLTEDKLCLGYVNQSKGVCAGDSGGALVFKNNFDNRYYLTGIVSVSPDVKPGAKCNSELYSLYTEVYSYIDFIREKTAEYQSTSDQLATTEIPSSTSRITWSHYNGGFGGTHNHGGGYGSYGKNTTTPPPPLEVLKICELPKQLANGNWTILGADRQIAAALEGTVLSFKCDEGYILSGTELNICKDAKWQNETPSCLKTCPQLGDVQSCVKRTKDIWSPVDCSQATDGTVATVQCDKKIGTSRNGSVYYNQAFSVCSGGNWSTVNCDPECGNNGNGTDDYGYSWKVAIYEVTADESPNFICGGVLINERIILTAAHCVSDSEGNKMNIRNYVATVGNHYAKFNDTRDSSAIQIHKLKKVSFPKSYKGYAKKFLGDIAVLVTDQCVKFSKSVEPACLDYRNFFEETQQEGLVVGWGTNNFNISNPPEHVDFSDELKVIKVVNLPKSGCQVEEDFKEFLAKDKICVGYPKNETNRVCVGDGGNGFVFKNPHDDDRFYLTALVSVTLHEACGDSSGFIRISDYLKWFVIEEILTYLPSKESCVSLLANSDLEENNPFSPNNKTFHDRVHSTSVVGHSTGWIHKGAGLG